MILVLDGGIAQDFWRLIYPSWRTPGYNGLTSVYSLPMESWAIRKKDVLKLTPKWLDEEFLSAGNQTLGCLTPNNPTRRKSKMHHVNSWSSPIPEGSLYNLGGNVFIPSPCFTLLLLATIIEFEELIAYGMELCGLYAFDPESPRGMRTRTMPLITSAQLCEYLETAKGCRGQETARRAAQFVLDGAASPMETLTAMLLHLPYRLGGYGLAAPIMNQEIPLDEHARAIAKRSKCRADICFSDIQLDVEYHGGYDHDNDESFDSDRSRVNGLKAAGYEVIELTSGQVFDLYAFEEIAAYIARRHRKRLKRECLGATPARTHLRETLFAWNRRFGHPK